MNTDLTFITNEPGQTLKDRFEVLIKDSRFFDCLVGYFYTTGFYTLYKALENTEKIRILIGIGTSRETYELIHSAKQQTLPFSHKETKQYYSQLVEKEMEDSDDSFNVEEGVNKFIEWIHSGKLEIRAYPDKNIHAKLYILTFTEGDRDIGRVITGSSNFTQSGLIENLEFNVELKNRADYEFARQKFEELWKYSVDVSKEYVQTVQTRTWLNANITPYELYLKFLYEYFKDQLSLTEDVFLKYYPENFMRLEYQEQAVLNAKKILEEYGGVFISDVVGVGKTYIGAMLAGQLDGRTMVLAPPILLNEKLKGSWPNVFRDFGVFAYFKSIGKLDDVLREIETREYKNVIIDEAHRFRTETTIGYEKLEQICRGKRVILVTATPFNNSPLDILNQIKLFQNARKSTIPNLPDLEGFFKRLDGRLRKVDREKNYDEYIKVVRENAKEIREKVLKYLMVRRTRGEIEKYFAEDLKKQNLKFPEIKDPIPLYYQLNDKEDKVFMKTVELITRNFRYARYTPLLYYKGKITEFEKTSQRNMGKFMKILLVKRLESSFYAFRKSIDRFIRSYELFIREFDRGNVYVSKKYINKIFELLENDDDEAVQRLVDEDKARRYNSEDFIPEFRDDLENDLRILKEINRLWLDIDRDPKLEKLQKELKENKILKDKKIIIFTESKETAEYLKSNLGEKTLCYTGSSSTTIRDKVIDNFDARAKEPKDDYQILVSTEVLSEGVNLHRSNVVINYDIPWNPTRMMQRVGRVNRVDTKFDEIYTFNFFPTAQAESEIQLKKIAETKINAFLTLLGGDAAILTEGEPVSSHELFDRLISRKTILGEEELEESELKYLNVIKEVRDNDPKLFEKIKHLPKKARSGRISPIEMKNGLLTYFRMGKLQKFFISDKRNEAQEVDFITAAKIFECSKDEPKQKLPEEFYELLDKNKQAFINTTTEETVSTRRSGQDNRAKLLKILKWLLKNSAKLTEEQEDFIKRVIEQLEKGAINKKTVQKTLKALDALKSEMINPLKVYGVIRQKIPEKLLESHYVESTWSYSGKREVILSLFLSGGKNE